MAHVCNQTPGRRKKTRGELQASQAHTRRLKQKEKKKEEGEKRKEKKVVEG